MCMWQVKLCDPLVTNGPYLSALEVRLDEALYKSTFTLLCCVKSSKRQSSKKAVPSRKSCKDPVDSSSCDVSQLIAQVPSTEFDLAQFVVAMGIIRRELRYATVFFTTKSCFHLRCILMLHMFFF